MDKIFEIINRIEQPLHFSSKENFRHLPLVRDMERAMTALARELQAALPPDASTQKTVSAFATLFIGFDQRGLPEKKEVLAHALAAIRSLREEDSPGDGSSFLPLPEIAGALTQLVRPVQFIKGIGPRLAEILQRKNVHSVEDLLYFFPRRYEDRRRVATVAEAVPGARETVIGPVTEARLQQYRHKKVYEVAIDDGTGVLTATWFKGSPAYLKNTFRAGRSVILTGEIRTYNGRKSMIHPDFEILDEQDDLSLHFRRIVPVYSETEGLHQKTLRRATKRALDEYGAYVHSPLPQWICDRRHLGPIGESIRFLHFPDAEADIDLLNEGKSSFHRRLIYDEFFFFELGMALKKQGQILEEGQAFVTGGGLVKRFYQTLSFALTAAQRRVIGEIEEDMARSSPMNRLLQGDVGSGKTVVSMAAMVTACDNGAQAAIMAPTEILAEQHYRNIHKWTDALGLATCLITGSRTGAAKTTVKQAVAAGEIQIVIGTHALIQEEVTFRNLGLAVIDEQHRFGVLQRAALRGKGKNPDVLVMTATPIPRTLAMTVYGDLDISVIDEMPPGKKPVRTEVFFEPQRERVYEIIRNELKKDHQVFIVYPLVAESENLDLKDATRMAEHLGRDIFPEYRLGLVHGKMKGRDKDRMMSAFLRKELNILVATTVIEVGIDIPEASVMVVEHAERFGLSQLHQLRGRVGRSDIPSYCLLLAQYAGSEEAKKRLGVMTRTNDGFRIAEEDLAIRGPGEFMGVRQSGLPDFRVANILRDGKILAEARADAFALVREDPRLEKPAHRPLKEILLHRWEGRLELARTG